MEPPVTNKETAPTIKNHLPDESDIWFPGKETIKEVYFKKFETRAEEIKIIN
jgi:hypothetical protein